MDSPPIIHQTAPPDPALLDRLAGPAREQFERRHNRSYGAQATVLDDEPIPFGRGAGPWLYDPAGTPYLDAFNGVAVLGHCHPKVVMAIAEQTATLAITARHLPEIGHAYAERLLATFPPGLSNLALTCTGSESTDLALRIVRHHTGGSGIIVSRHARHGNTAAAAAISPALGPFVAVGEDVRTVTPPDLYRFPSPHPGARLAEQAARAIADMQRHGIRFAGMIVDSVFASDGIYTEPPGVLAEVVEVVHAAGGLFIADEVQAGFGRTGSHLWGFERHGIVPDAVIMGKAMGNGYPIAGVAVRPEVYEDFSRRAGFGATFGGTPVGCAAGLAVLDTIAEEGLMANALIIGDYFRARLKALKADFPCIGDVRGAGLYIGIEFSVPDGSRTPSPGWATAAVTGLRHRRILTGLTGPQANVLKIRPPLGFTRADVDQVVTALADSL